MQGKLFTDHANNKPELSIRSAESSLITKDRSQKLDLLIHLISNLKQSLVVCGPSGIGKTTLLNEFKKRNNDIWPIHTIQASSDLSFESVQEQLCKFLIQNYAEYRNHELKSLLSMLKKQNQKIVIIIDDAGYLIPGLISSLIQFATAYSSIRIVFSLTHDELHIKNSSDQMINDCHFIEIPPLTEKQCGVFLQNLSSQPEATISFNAISELLIEKLYRETHGIPGNIISELPKLSNYKVTHSNKWVYIAVGFIVVLVGGRFIVSDESGLKSSKEEIKTPLILQESEEVKISAPVIHPLSVYKMSEVRPKQFGHKEDAGTLFVTDTIDNNSLIVKDSDKKPQLEQEPVVEKVTQGDGLKNEAIEKLEENSKEAVMRAPVNEKITDSFTAIAYQYNTLEEKKVESKNKEEVRPEIIGPVTGVDDSQWVLNQPGGNYTIQLMVLSRYESVVEFIRKQQKNIKERLKYFQITNQGQKKYVLIFGSFENMASASKEMISLPVKYRKSWVRRFRILQKKINN